MQPITYNRLAHAASPYLRQHAANPVDWFEWGEEALDKAKAENKPLLISIGYASCHWCHVMAQESFSNTAIAGLMNRHFVCIKIDREERPDIDQIYMEAAQLINGRGGWPLNAFALPDGRPFYAATYFQPHQWKELLQQLADLYETDFPKVEEAASSLTKGLQTNPLSVTFDEETESDIILQSDYHEAFESLLSQVDLLSGGFKGTPKFMLPVGWEALLQYYSLTGKKNVLSAVTYTLDSMARGGIYDQIGGGFARYSTDGQWKVPHFEKMLYDNAQLITLYAHAWQVTRKPEYQTIAEQTIAFAERELRNPEGGFYSSIDADSEHEEGKFYVWTKEEFEHSLESTDTGLLSHFYHISTNGNWEKGKNILHYTVDKEEFALKNGVDPGDFDNILQEANKLLFNARSKRVRPSTDEKIITPWNALMISAYVSAYKAFGNPAYLQRATELVGFVKKYLLHDDILYRTCMDGKVSTEAFLDDYAFLADAMLSLYEVTFDIHHVQLADRLTNYVLHHFTDEEHQLFYYTSDKSEPLIARKYDYTDNVMPSSNSRMAHVLLKLGRLTDNLIYQQRAEVMLKTIGQRYIQGGAYFANWTILAGKITHPSIEIVVTGENALSEALRLQQHYLPLTVIAGGDDATLPLLKERANDKDLSFYICRNNTCGLPVHSMEEALQLLRT
ncbi:thioredoxin domain-containing protein [Paludibacter sp.]|uniref:thioredoxin domain-containing protein n=1 Tax=Paludibacter sp. TaxID=1898105 RepID=UPI0013537278|nr:thioredoxin domain-containing protein [Paludibacter sp.]MTK53841.1 thioredoxin domain-containing protein [Paludibacter sp.]